MDRLLRRVRDALRNAVRPPRPEDPPTSAPMEDAATAFTRALERAAGRVVRVETPAQAREWMSREYAGQVVVDLADNPSEQDLRGAEVGVDRADVLLAETGTVVRSYESREASRISLVPPVSVFLARTADIVPGYPEVFPRLAEHHRGGRAYTVLITGPSRTADIEKELVIPAHGPRELIVFLLP